mmetsp:Transcript_11535/g.28426  ORF Transcript_11535/g.28426 Transcript_11535/m.28426 type:complete len:91 (+) Transcript_11535:958-1230(+)
MGSKKCAQNSRSTLITGRHTKRTSFLLSAIEIKYSLQKDGRKLSWNSIIQLMKSNNSRRDTVQLHDFNGRNKHSIRASGYYQQLTAYEDS